MLISAENFKWMTGEEFDLRKITVMIGENSGGKSTITKLMLFLKQNLSRGSTRFAYQLNGGSVKLGQFRDIVRNHDENETVSIKCTVTKSEYLPFYELFVTAANKLTEAEREEIKEWFGDAYGNDVSVQWILPKDETDTLGVNIRIYVANLGEIHISPKKPRKDRTIEFSESDLFVIKYQFSNGKRGRFTVEGSRSNLLFSINSKLVKKEGGEELVKKIGYFVLAIPFVAHFMNGIEYINPLNSQPTRYIDITSIDSDSNSGDYGQAAAQIASLKGGEGFESTLSEALIDLGIADSFQLKKANNMPYAEYILKKNGIENNAVDLGYGVGLQIGVLSKIIQNQKRKGKIFIIEQPEVHLHPKLQAKFIEAILKYSAGMNFVIETHSEHLLRKLQVLAKEKRNKLLPSDIVVYYFKSADCDRVTLHKINEEGYVEPKFPPGFYDNTFELVKELNAK